MPQTAKVDVGAARPETKPAIGPEVWSRRRVLAAAGLAGGALAAGVPELLADGASPRPSGVPGLVAERAGPLAVPPPDPDLHAAGRASFGLSEADVAEVRALGLETWLDRQLHPESIDDGDLDAEIAAAFPTLALPPAELLARSRAEVARELKAATVLRALRSRRQLHEVMVELWSNHFSVYHADGPVTALKTVEDREVVRPRVFGRFRDLLGASAKSPAMLVYLDNYVNTAEGPNENYARELMELHTLGVDAGFTQEDVEAVARCFTGWTIAPRGPSQGRFVFVRRLHDDGPKRVLGVDVPAGGGVEDGETVLDVLADHPATARHVATKICRRLVSDSPPAGAVETVAAELTASGGDVRRALAALFATEEFRTSTDAKVKRPVELLVSALRTLEARVQPGAERSLLGILFTLGQLPFDWAPPNGYPDVAGAWTGTNGMLDRWNLALALAANRLPGIRIDHAALLARAGGGGQPTAGGLVDGLSSVILRRSLTRADRDALVSYAAGDGPEDGPLPAGALRVALPVLVALLLDSPYFHLR